MAIPDDAKIDLSRYKTDELASRIAEILSVPESIRTVLRTVFFAVLLLVVANTLIYVVGNRALFPWMFSTVYALAVAVILGFVLGLIRVAGLLLSRSESLLQLTLETSRAVSNDYQQVRGREKRMPAATEIVEHVYDGVVLPVMETIVAKTFGIVGKPLLWIYRGTIGGGVRFLITRMKTASLSEDERTEIIRVTDGLMRDVGENASNIESSLDNALGYTGYATQVLRKALLRPVQLVFLLVAFVAVVPLGLCWYWTR